MATPGPVVHQQLMDAYQDMQTALEAERAQMSDARAARNDLNDRRLEALVRLAEHYLPELSRDAIEKTWRDAQPGVTSLLLRKEDHQRQLQENLIQFTAGRDGEQKKLLEFNRKLDEATAMQQQVAEQVRQRLSEDDQFVLLSDRAAVAEGALERAEANLQEIDQDAVRKLPAYDESSLFRYLYDRGYGTPSYKSRGFTRRMDRMLAKYIGYQQAKSGYDFLKRTPDQMRKIIAQDRETLDTVMKELEQQRDGVAEQFGLPARLQECESLQSQRDTHLNNYDQLRLQVEASEKELVELEDARGDFYREAIEQFRDVLDKAGIQTLKERAKATAEITDDQIVARVLGVEREIDELDESTKQRHEKLTGKLDFLSGLGRIIQKFRAAQFDSSRSNFVGSLSIAEEVTQAIVVDDIDYLWKRIRGAQRWGEIHPDQDSAQREDTMGQVLTEGMAYAAGSTLGSLAKKAGYRRTGGHSQDDDRTDDGQTGTDLDRS